MIGYVEDVSPGKATGPVAEIYGQIRRDFGAVPEPFRLHSASPRLLGGFWAVCRETLLAGRAPRHLTELVATVVSQVNTCPYCVEAHTTMLRADGQGALANWLLNRGSAGRTTESERALAAWAAATLSPGATVLADPPFDARLAPELIGTAVAFHYINRMVTILAPESPLPGPRVVRPLARRAAPRLFARALNRPKNPGDSLRFVDRAELPSDLGWAQSSPSVASAFAGFVAAIESEAQEAIGADARTVVRTRIGAWTGEEQGPSRAWAWEAVAELDEADAAAARLALLAALAPHQVDERVIAPYRRHRKGGASLLALLSWSSAQAARQIGTWCHLSVGNPVTTT